jgi:hypothetical protein
MTPAFSLPPILALSWAGQVTVVSLGVVAAVIAIVLSLASRTKWGQSKPLTKCIALAVLAHVWLLMYAYGTRVERPGNGEGRGGQGYPSLTTIEFLDGPAVPPPAVEDLAIPSTLDHVSAIEAGQASSDSPMPGLADNHPPEFRAGDEELQPPEVLPTSARPIEEPATPAAESQPVVTAESPSIDAPLANQDSPVELNQGPASSVERLEETSPATPPSQVEAMAAGGHPELQGKVAVAARTRLRSGDQRPVPEMYRGRLSEQRSQIALQMGGDAQTEAAVEAALEWLAMNQERLAEAPATAGSWDAARHGAGRETRTLEKDRRGTGSKADTGMTGLALLAFLGAGCTPEHPRYGATVQAAIDYLVRVQWPSGDLAGPKQVGAGDDVRYARMYCHGMALFALAEAYALTGDPRLIEPIHRGALHTLKFQNPQSGGWRYQAPIAGEPGDLSQFGWQAMAWLSAQHAGFALSPELRSRLYRFLDSVAAGRHGGLAVYRPLPGQIPTVSMTAEALATRRLLGYPLTAAAEQEAEAALLQALPGTGEENVYYWYYATLALFPKQDARWQQWNQALKSHLVATQQSGGAMHGSWDPRCIWGGYGGRVYSTAMSCLCLEVYYRYLPLYQTTAGTAAEGPIAALPSEPLPRAPRPSQTIQR